MNLYLLRHGIAVEAHEWDGSDATRPLTPEGFDRTTAVLRQIHKKKKIQAEVIWHSPLVRAQQTAEIAAEVLELKLTLCPELACGMTLRKLEHAFKKTPAPEAVLLVGHEPDFGELSAELQGLDSPQPFKKAGLALLQGDFKAGKMKLEWYLTPKDVL